MSFDTELIFSYTKKKTNKKPNKKPLQIFSFFAWIFLIGNLQPFEPLFPERQWIICVDFKFLYVWVYLFLPELETFFYFLLIENIFSFILSSWILIKTNVKWSVAIYWWVLGILLLCFPVCIFSLFKFSSLLLFYPLCSQFQSFFPCFCFTIPCHCLWLTTVSVTTYILASFLSLCYLAVESIDFIFLRFLILMLGKITGCALYSAPFVFYIVPLWFLLKSYILRSNPSIEAQNV